MKKLSIDNPFFEFMSNLADLVMLNITWVITCIPVVTIGAAQTAFYRIMLRRVRGTCVYPVREYLAAFKEEFGKSTKIWIGFLIIGAVLVFDLMYMGQTWTAWGIAVGVLLFLWVILVSYVFPVMAQFENTLKNTMKNACYMAVRHLPYTIGIIILNLIPVFCFLAGGAIMQVTLPVYMVIGFAVTARINAAMFRNIFEKYIPETEKVQGTDEEAEV